MRETGLNFQNTFSISSPKKLPDISDFIRFRAVCKSWQLSAPVTDPPPQLPWLLERCQDIENAIIRFYCLSSGKVHTITCPGSRRATLKGPACRYLLASCSRSISLILLFVIRSMSLFFTVFGFLPDYIGPGPIEGGDIVIISGYITMMAFFWRPEADDWVSVEGVGNWYGGSAYYMGQYFSNNFVTGITNVTDIVTKKLAYQVAPPEGTNPLLEGRTIIVASGGKMLRLFHQFKAEPCHFDIYCLYFGNGEGKPCWVKITDIGDQMLFLQDHRGLSFCASNFVGFKGNYIYFLKERQHLYRYGIGDGTTEVLPCPFDSMETWFVPSLV